MRLKSVNHSFAVRHGVVSCFALALAFFTGSQVWAQGGFGYRWVKPIPSEYDWEYASDLKSKNGKLYSLNTATINRYDSSGNVDKVHSTTHLLFAWNASRFWVSGSENFLIETMVDPPWCGVGDPLPPYGGVFQNFLYPKSNNQYYSWPYDYFSFFSNIDRTKSSVISPEDRVFTHTERYQVGLNYQYHFQVGDTARYIKWKKSVLANLSSPILYNTATNQRFLVTCITNDTVYIDSSTAIPVSSPSVVHLYFDTLGNLAEQKVVPNHLHVAGMENVSWYLQPDNSLYQSFTVFDSTLNQKTQQIRFVDENGQIRWEKRYISQSRLPNLITLSPDDSMNVLCAFLQPRNGKQYLGFELLNRFGNSIWVDSSGQTAVEETGIKIANIGQMNWATSLITVNPVIFGDFNVPNPLQDGKGFILNLQGVPNLAVSAASAYCVSDSATVYVLNTPLTASADTFSIQLSDANGSFAQPVVIGRGTTKAIRIGFPAGIQPGDQYRIRAYSALHNEFGPVSGLMSVSRAPERPVITSSSGLFSACSEETIVLKTEGTPTFRWSTGAFSNQIETWVGTSYYVDAIIGGCTTRSDTVTIEGFQDFVSYSFPTTFCGSTETIDLTTLPASGRWYGPQVDSTGKKFSALAANADVVLYFKDVSHPNCPLYDSVYMAQGIRPVIEKMSDTIACQQNVTVQLANINLPNTVWKKGYNTIESFFSLNNPGTHILRCESGIDFCIAMDTVSITVLAANVSPCYGMDSLPDFEFPVQSKNCTPSNYYTQVQTANGNLQSVTGYEIQLSDSAGSFTNYRVIGSSNQPIFSLQFPESILEGVHYRTRLRLSSPDTILEPNPAFIRIFHKPAAPVIQLLGAGVFCSGDMPGLNRLFVSNGLVNTWMPGAVVADTITPTLGLAYSVTTDNHGCFANSLNSKKINAIKTPVVHMTVSPNVCVPKVGFLLKTNAAGGTWTGLQVDSTNGQFNPGNTDDTIVVRYRNYVSGIPCPVDTTFRIFQLRKPVIPATDTFRICQNDNLLPLPYPQYTNTWTGVGIVNQQYFNPLMSTGNHAVQLLAKHGFCSLNTSVMFNVKDSLDPDCQTTEVISFSKAGTSQLFPNPNNGSFQLQSGSHLYPEHIRIINALGQEIKPTYLQVLAPGSVEVKGIPPGYYHVKTGSGKGISFTVY